MEQYLTMEVPVRAPKNRNEKSEKPGYREKVLHKKKFTVAGIWYLQKISGRRRRGRIVFN